MFDGWRLGKERSEGPSGLLSRDWVLYLEVTNVRCDEVMRSSV